MQQTPTVVTERSALATDSRAFSMRSSSTSSDQLPVPRDELEDDRADVKGTCTP